MEHYLTPKGLEKLKQELNYLKKVKRKEIAKRLKEAASFGDLTENAAWQEAKEAQAFLEGKILELESLIRNSKLVKKEEKMGWVQIGSTVILSSGKEKEKFEIVGAAEADPFKNKISCNSPLGKALLGKPEKAEVTLETPKEKIKYKILKID